GRVAAWAVCFRARRSSPRSPQPSEERRQRIPIGPRALGVPRPPAQTLVPKRVVSEVHDRALVALSDDMHALRTLRPPRIAPRLCVVRHNFDLPSTACALAAAPRYSTQRTAGRFDDLRKGRLVVAVRPTAVARAGGRPRRANPN